MATAGSRAALFLSRSALGSGLFAVESSGRSVAMGQGTPTPSASRLAFRPAHTPYGGSRVGPPSPSKRLDLRLAHTPYGACTRGTFGSGLFAVERSGRSNVVGHQLKPPRGKACQL